MGQSKHALAAAGELHRKPKLARRARAPGLKPRFHPHWSPPRRWMTPGWRIARLVGATLGAVDGVLSMSRPASTASLQPRFAVRATAVRWFALGVYAVAMAYVEAAAVLYLRTILGGVDPVGRRSTLFQPLPDFVWLEVGREAATLVMLAATGWMAGRGLAGRLGGFALAFGLWDIFYYVFLRLFSGWPASPLAPDVLFLIPVPWWGPVLAPGLVAATMTLAGAAAMARELGNGVPRPTRGDLASIVGGTLVCLVAFMADGLRMLITAGVERAYYARGGPFAWPVFLVGLAVAAVGLWRLLTRASPGATLSGR